MAKKEAVPDRRRPPPGLRNEKTGEAVGSIAAKGLRYPETLTHAEIRKVAAAALTQRPDQKK